MAVAGPGLPDPGHFTCARPSGASNPLRGCVMNAPVRRLIKPTTPRTVHLLNISTLDRPVQAEASTEADFVRLAALCPSVKRIEAQPCTLDLDGRRFTPDYRIECHSGVSSYWEVKLETRFDKYRPLFNDASRHLAGLGARFYAVSNVSLRRGDQHHAAALIHRYGKARPAEADLERVLQAAGGFAQGCPAASLAARAQVPLELIYHLIARRRLTFRRRVGVHDLLILPEHLENQDDLQLASWLDVSPWRTNAGTGARVA